jgi:DNA invertase Pin-like site-specific DNA recombinase
VAGEQQHGKARGRPGPDPEQVARARELRAAGESNRAIGAELGVDHKTVGRWLEGEERHGPDGRFKPRADVDPDEVARLRAETVTRERPKSWREIGRELGVSPETARRRYKSPENIPAAE